jgi:hypothetical protein
VADSNVPSIIPMRRRSLPLSIGIVEAYFFFFGRFEDLVVSVTVVRGLRFAVFAETYLPVTADLCAFLVAIGEF